jgi:hypothetical protein
MTIVIENFYLNIYDKCLSRNSMPATTLRLMGMTGGEVRQIIQKIKGFSANNDVLNMRSTNSFWRVSCRTIFVSIVLSFMFYPSAYAIPNFKPEVLPELLLSTAADPFAFSQVGETVTFQYVVTNSGLSTIGPTQITISHEKINSGTAFDCGDQNTVLGPSMSTTCDRQYIISETDLNSAVILTRAIARSATLESNIATVTLINVIGSTSTSTPTPSTSSTITTTIPIRLIDIGSIPEPESTSVAPLVTRPPINVRLIQELPATGKNTNYIVATVFGLVIFGSLFLNLSNYQNTNRSSSNRLNNREKQGIK